MRHLTKSDFDGIVCNSILAKSGISIDDVKFVHADDVVAGKVPILGTDVMTCLPYDSRCALSFDYHSTNRPERAGKHIFDSDSPSCARILYNYYHDLIDIDESLIIAVDKHCSGDISYISAPKDWDLVGVLTDSRTGLGRWRDFRISNYAFMKRMLDLVQSASLSEILDDADVVERVNFLRQQHNSFASQLKRCTKVRDGIAIADYRGEDTIYCGSRFFIYTLFPQASYVMRVMWGLRHSNVVIALSESTTNKVGKGVVPVICSKFGGFANKYSGSFQLSLDRVESAIRDIRNLLSE